VAVALLAGVHADAVAYLSARAALHRAAVAGLRAVGPVGAEARRGAATDATVDDAARAAWAAEPSAVRALGVPRFSVRVTTRDGWPMVDVEAAVAVDLPWGVAGWLARGPVVRVRGVGAGD
jgi:hypothetical protein